jgi:hypothetical protein
VANFDVKCGFSELQTWYSNCRLGIRIADLVFELQTWRIVLAQSRRRRYFRLELNRLPEPGTRADGH